MRVFKQTLKQAKVHSALKTSIKFDTNCLDSFGCSIYMLDLNI